MSKEIIIKGYKPREWQSELHNAMKNAYQSGKRFIVKSHRQCGKSYAAQYELLRFSLEHSNTISMYIAPVQNQTRKMFRDLERRLITTGLVESSNSTLLEIHFINGSSILFRSAEMRDNLRGYTINGILICDEAAFISDEVYDIVFPSTNVWSAPILLISTPKWKKGKFYDFYIATDSRFVKFDWSKYDTSEFLPTDQKELYKLTMSKAMYTNEILGEFYDDGGELFIGITDCIIDYKPELFDLHFGIDWAIGGNDYTAITCLNGNSELCFIKYFNNKTPTEQIDLIVDLINQYKPIKITVEKNSIGGVYLDMLKKRVKTRIDSFVTTNKSKSEIINRLRAAIENGTIKLIRDDELLMELRSYEMQYNPRTGTITYNAPNGFKDDLVMSLAICYWSIANRMGNYNLKIV